MCIRDSSSFVLPFGLTSVQSTWKKRSSTTPAVRGDSAQLPTQAPTSTRRVPLRKRIQSSLGIIAVGIVSSLLGGAIFAAVLTALAVGVYYEVSRMTPVIG